jgi:hypothetical protein
VVGRPSSDAARLHANRRIFITSLGDPTVPASSTHQLLRNQEFAMVTAVISRNDAGIMSVPAATPIRQGIQLSFRRNRSGYDPEMQIT